MVTSLRAVAQNPGADGSLGIDRRSACWSRDRCRSSSALPSSSRCSAMPPGTSIGETIEPELNPQPLPPRAPRERRPAADFPANLFPWRRKDGA